MLEKISQKNFKTAISIENRKTKKKKTNFKQVSLFTEFDPKPSLSFQEMIDEAIPITDSTTKPFTEKLAAFWKELPELEKEFILKPSAKNLYKYKKLVMNIVNTTIKNNSNIHRVHKRNRKTREIQELSVVSFIDTRLQKMLEIILSKRNTAFQILASIEDIRGLLLSLRK